MNLHAQYLGLKQPNIEAALKQVNLLDARKKLFSQLSLGMRQRLGIARAFLGDVQYLLLDEPTNGLDPMGIKEIRLLLKERLKSPQHCILVSSHNLTEIAAVTDVLIFIRGGKIIKIVKNDYNEKELEAVTYERETKSVAFQGRSLCWKASRRYFPRRRKHSAKKKLSVVFMRCSANMETDFPNHSQHCCPGLLMV